MASQWLADLNDEAATEVRDVVRESWSRAQQRELDPDQLLAPLQFESAELREYRESHPLAQMMPVIRKLLVQDADNDSGMLVAVGDSMGRLLWVEGDQGLKSRAEEMMFVEGSDWSEAVAGTSAPGTALALDHAIQIKRDEHFNRRVHAWSCTAVPVHDLETHAILGVIDITGGEQAVDRHTMPLMIATARAVENELLLERLKSRTVSAQRTERSPRHILFNVRSTVKQTKARPILQVLGRDTALITLGEQSLELTTRHAEIVTLLAFHRGGLSAERLSELLWGDPHASARLRPEMVRLRKTLEQLSPGLSPESKPYRIATEFELDAQQVVALLDRGAHRAALSAYVGALLPTSVAPGIEQIRDEISASVRASILSDGSVEVLLEFANSPHGATDVDVWREVLRLLPARSPKRARVVAHLEEILNG